jgi:hypothetical protein
LIRSPTITKGRPGPIWMVLVFELSVVSMASPRDEISVPVVYRV